MKLPKDAALELLALQIGKEAGDIAEEISLAIRRAGHPSEYFYERALDEIEQLRSACNALSLRLEKLLLEKRPEARRSQPCSWE
jgi:hypothetical protein